MRQLDAHVRLAQTLLLQRIATRGHHCFHRCASCLAIRLVETDVQLDTITDGVCEDDPSCLEAWGLSPERARAYAARAQATRLGSPAMVVGGNGRAA